MNNKELKAGTNDEQRDAADSIPSASLAQNGLLGEGIRVLIACEESLYLLI